MLEGGGLVGSLVLLGELGRGVLTDLLVGTSIDILDAVSLNTVIKVRLEDLAEALLIIVSKLLHVLGDVATDNVLLKSLGVELLGLDVPTRETLAAVRNIKATVAGTLESTEDTSTSSGAGQTNIKEDLERTGSILDLLGDAELTRVLLVADVGFVEAELLKSTTGNEKTSGIGGRPVGKAVLDAVTRKLVGVSSSEDKIALDLRADDLADNVLLGETDNKTVLRGAVLGLVLSDKALAGEVVGLSLASTTERRLVTRVVGAAHLGLLERHFIGA